MREPIEVIFAASKLLSKAADEHLKGNWSEAEDLILQSEKPEIRAWTESLWGSKKANPNQQIYHRVRGVDGLPAILSKRDRLPVRMPSAQQKSEVIDKFGRNCAFCGIPLISREVRVFLKKQYPNSLSWGRTNQTQHSAFQCMWLQFDHVIPHCYGGDNSTGNIVPACAGCNFGRMDRMLEQVGIADPREIKISKSTWDGLERVRARRR